MNIELEITINDELGEYYGEKREEIHKFDMVEIPVDESQILESKVFIQKKSMEFDHADLHITEFTVSPTRMSIDIRIQEKKGCDIKDLYNFYIKDDKDNIYEPTGTIGIFKTNNREQLDKASMYFVPSIYFDGDIKELYLCGGRIDYYEPEEGLVTLDVDANYPYEKIINGEKVTFYKPERNENEDLVINFDAPTEYVYLQHKIYYREKLKGVSLRKTT